MREIMDAVTDPLVSEVTFMAAAQVGKTEGLINNAVGYYMDMDPSPVMVVMESDDKAAAWSKERLMPMLLETPCLREKITLGKGPDSANTISYKDYPGGYLAIVSAGSEAHLSSRPIKILLKDEIDKWRMLNAGDPDSLVDKRTATYRHNRKIINVSTPRDHHPPDIISRIYEKYLSSDMRKYYVPCPFCRHYQILREGQLKFTRPGNTGTVVDEVWYECENPECTAKKISPIHKRRMIENGKWIAEKPFKGHAGFWINTLYSPWVSWKEYAEAKLRMTRQRDTHKTFHNEWRGEAWNPVMETNKDISPYLTRREYYTKVPMRAAIITAAADIQRDRIEVEVRAWGIGRESWGLEHRILWGEPALLTTGHLPPVWQQLEELRQHTWEHESGVALNISRMFIDMGYLQSEVLRFCRGKRPLVWPCKGMNDTTSRAPLVSRRPVKDQRERYLYYPIGPNEAKDIIFANLAIEPPAEQTQPCPGYMHYNQNYDEEYFKQLLTSEVGRWQRGIYVYRKITESVRNEALDLSVMNLAAYESMGIDPAPLVEALQRHKKTSDEADKTQTPANNIPKRQTSIRGRRILSEGVE